ncbi:MAG: sensor histidine kinase [Gemmatimonadota bacterium]|nr:sensor histidine kinase [Gemmatimonadota bacterium]
MPRERPRFSVWRLWGLAFAILVPLSVFALTIAFTARKLAGLPVGPVLGASVVMDWGLWALALPGVVWLARRFPLDAGNWLRGLSIHFVLGGLVAGVEMIGFSLTEWFILRPFITNATITTFADTVWVNLSFWYPYSLLVYWIIAIATQAVETSRRSRERELEAAHLREELTRAQLTTLRMQLNPHFLCNTLNTASVFMRDGRSEDAIEVVVGLGDLLNRTLDAMETPEVTLREELAFIDRYLGIERRRFSDRLETRISVEPELMEALVPNMILQPLVENAIRHGLSKTPGDGLLEIRATAEGPSLRISVRDDGPGFDRAALRSLGVGLDNTLRRLERLFGSAGGLEIGNGEDGGAEVTLTLPLETRRSGTRYDRAS